MNKSFNKILFVILVILIIYGIIETIRMNNNNNVEVEILTVNRNETYSINTLKYNEKQIEYKVEDSSVLYVTENGEIKAIKEGKTKVTLLDKNKKEIAKFEVIVNIPKEEQITHEKKTLEKISFNNDKESLYIGSTKDLSKSIVVTPLDIEVNKYTWQSSDNTVVSVNENGIITALKEGSSIIKATTENISTSIIINVLKKKIEVSKITTSVSKKEMIVGESALINVTLSPKNATENKVTYESSNIDVAIIDEKGIVTAKKEGTTKILVTTQNKKTSSINITVKAKPIVVENPGNNDKTAPICKYEGESTLWTNKDRIITITCLDENGGSGCTKETKKVTKVFKNTTTFAYLNYYVMDNAGNKTLCDKKLNIYVDKEPPSTTPIIKLYNNQNNSDFNTQVGLRGLVNKRTESQSVVMYTDKKDVVLSFNSAEDNKSGIAGYAYATLRTDGQAGPDSKKIDFNSNSIKFTATDDNWVIYYIYSKDKAGNYSKAYTRVAVRYSKDISKNITNAPLLFDDNITSINNDLNNKNGLSNKTWKDNKQKFSFSKYTAYQQRYLDSYLKNKISLAGYKTRNGVVAAARFLSIQLNNRLQYVSSNVYPFEGLNYVGKTVVDPAIKFRPKDGYSVDENGNPIWNKLYSELKREYSSWNKVLAKDENNDNVISTSEQGSGGMQCSGFVNWALSNAGYTEILKKDYESYRNRIDSKGAPYTSAFRSSYSISAMGLCNYIEGSTVISKNVYDRLDNYYSDEYSGLKEALINNYSKLGNYTLPKTEYIGNTTNAWDKVKDRIKPGDLICKPGHVGMIIDKTTENGEIYYYVAHEANHSPRNGLQLMKVNAKTLVGKTSYENDYEWLSVVLMDKVYN